MVKSVLEKPVAVNASQQYSRHATWLWRLPTLISNQRDKRKSPQIVSDYFATLAIYSVQMLARLLLPDRDHDTSTIGELVDICGRQTLSGCGHDDRVERSLVWEPKGTVPDVNMNISKI